MGKPLHGLATGEMTAADWAPQPEGGLGVHLVTVGGVGRVDTARDVLAVVSSDGGSEPALGDR